MLQWNPTLTSKRPTLGWGTRLLETKPLKGCLILRGLRYR